MEKKIKIALVVDSDNWAFANIARNVSKNLSKYYDFKIVPISYFENNLVKLYFSVLDCDLIHLFWRGNVIALKYLTDYLEEIGTDLDRFTDEFLKDKIITTSVYDHMFLDDEIDGTKEIFNECSSYYVSSNKLYNIYNNLDIKYKPKYVITDGVDLNDFYPINIKRFDNISKRKIVIGWSGNSEWNSHKEDFKGLNTILKPVIDELIEEGYPIEYYFADRQSGMIPHDEMANYYSKIDVYICPSKIEGTPNPILESMACGIPVITTDVGIVKQVFGKRQKEFILKERTKECLKERMIHLIENPKLFEELGKENTEQIKNWTWEKVSKKFKKFFDDVLNEYEKK